MSLVEPDLSVWDALIQSGEADKWLDSLSEAQLNTLPYDWDFWARPKQLPPPGAWFVWLVLAGRGFGKTRAGAEWIRLLVESGQVERIALVGATAADVRDVMVEGHSGLLSVFPPDKRPKYEPSKRRVTFHNGAVATTFSADKPDRLRGPNHEAAWADELAAWRYPESWDMLQLGVRLGATPQIMVTTTPKPTAVIKGLVADPDTVTTTGSTYENRINLSAKFLERITARYAGTRMGRQELWAEILDEVEGALWTYHLIDATRVARYPLDEAGKQGDILEQLQRIVVGVDPSASAMMTGQAEGYVVDYYSMRCSPAEWARAAVQAYHDHDANLVVAEGNQGGEMVRHTIHSIDPTVQVQIVHAAHGKQARAEPVSALYEQGKVHHIGTMGDLEDQMCSWVPGTGESPDRLDALVWALTELVVGPQTVAPVVPAQLNVQDSPYRQT
jgi:phage terminase large subunit-like protein